MARKRRSQRHRGRQGFTVASREGGARGEEREQEDEKMEEEVAEAEKEVEERMEEESAGPSGYRQ